MLEWAATGNKSEEMETLKEEAQPDIYIYIRVKCWLKRRKPKARLSWI
jgi:hypothetical protein